MNLPRSCRRVAPALALFAMLLPARPAHAVSKEIIQLQTQVQQLIDSLARLQQSNDEQMGVMKDLLQQTVDSVNKMTVTVNGMQLKLQNQSDAQSTRNDQISGQVQALNDSLDELKARMMRMEKTLGNLQTQAQSTNTILGNLPGANGAPAGGGAAPTAAPPASPVPPAGSPIPAPGSSPSQGGAGSPQTSGPTEAEPIAQPVPQPDARSAGQPAPLAGGPSVAAMYRTAYGDYMAGKYPLATSEFRDLIKAHPDDNLAGNAFFYIGEMDMRGSKPAVAVKSYDQVLERYPDNAKIPAARLHKGEALIAMKQTEAGVRELRALVQRYPNSPEAAQARTRLRALHVPIYTRGRID